MSNTVLVITNRHGRDEFHLKMHFIDSIRPDSMLLDMGPFKHIYLSL